MNCEHIRECIDSVEKAQKKYTDCGRRDCLQSCDARNVIAVQENGKRYELRNSGDVVAVYQVDGAMLESLKNVKCDKMIVDVTLMKAILVELKGRDLRHALEQLESTFNRVERAVAGYKIYGRIVTSHRTNVPNLKTDPRYIKLRKKFGLHQGNIKTAVQRMSESVMEI